MRECGETGSVKKEGGSVKKKESVTIRESKNLTYSSYVQLICTVLNILQILQISLHFDPLTSPFLAHPTSMLEYNVRHLKTKVCKIIF
jgi:hypothetical protein